MTASPSSTNQSQTGNKYGLTSIGSVTNKPNLKIISSQGQIQIYSSPYRGSFSSVMSEALRSAGLGSRVLIAQFLKGGVEQGPQHDKTRPFKRLSLHHGCHFKRENADCCL